MGRKRKLTGVFEAVIDGGEVCTYYGRVAEYPDVQDFLYAVKKAYGWPEFPVTVTRKYVAVRPVSPLDNFSFDYWLDPYYEPGRGRMDVWSVDVVT